MVVAARHSASECQLVCNRAECCAEQGLECDPCRLVVGQQSIPVG